MIRLIIIFLFPVLLFAQAGPPDIGLVGVATLSTDWSSSSTSYVDVTGLSVASVVVNDGDNIKITVDLAVSHTTGTTGMATFAILRGTTILNEEQQRTYDVVSPHSTTLVWVDEDPGAGTYTYKLQFKTDSGTDTIQASGTDEAPIFTVEKI